jgi:hypothetical protein
MQHTPIHDAPRERQHQVGVRNAAEGNHHKLPISKTFRSSSP